MSLRWVKVWAQRHCLDRGQRITAARRKGFFFPCYILEGGLAETPLLDPLRQSAVYSWRYLKTFEPNRQNGELLFGEMGPH